MRITSTVAAFCLGVLLVSGGCVEDRREGLKKSFPDDVTLEGPADDSTPGDQAGLTGDGEAVGQENVGPIGWSRERVMELQTSLRDRGFDPGAIDGIIGPETRQALRRFQEANGLAATGQVNDRTLAELGLA